MTELTGIQVVFETENELVVIKPAGMATELTSDPRGVSLIRRMRRTGRREARLPHRLDRMSRGLVVVALTKESIAHHNAEVRARRWAKFYLTRIESPSDPRTLVGAHRAHLRTVAHRAEIVRSGGKLSIMEILDCAPAPGRPGEAHALIRLRTGRFHQIRAMVADLGSPIVGDHSYGGARPAAGDPPYLEHAALRFRPLGESEPRVVYEAADPGREPIAESLLATLSQAIADSLEESIP